MVSGSTEKTPDLTMSPGQTRGPTSLLLLPKTAGGKALRVSAVPLSLTLTNQERTQRALSTGLRSHSQSCDRRDGCYYSHCTKEENGSERWLAQGHRADGTPGLEPGLQVACLWAWPLSETSGRHAASCFTNQHILGGKSFCQRGREASGPAMAVAGSGDSPGAGQDRMGELSTLVRRRCQERAPPLPRCCP